MTAVALWLVACSPSDDSGSAESAPPDTPTSESSAEEGPVEEDEAPAESDGEGRAPIEPLGFETDRFEIPIPVPAESGEPFADLEELIAAGEDAGVWT
ncbi:MAG: hypothetical protein AAGA42_20465, partial [Actinomycetota bacterium]